MKNNIMNINSRQGVLFYIFMLLPIVDSINGYFIRQKNFYGIGSSYHLMILILVILFTINNKSIVIGKFEVLTFLLFFSFVISFAVNYFFGVNVTSIALERSNKIVYTAIMITCLYRMKKQSIVDNSFYDYILNVQTWMIAVLVFVCNISGFYNYSYKVSKSGRIGMYTNLNELVLMFTIFILLEIKQIAEEFKIGTLIKILLCEIDLVFTESKFGITMAIFAMIIMIFSLIKINKRGLSKITLAFLTCMLPSSIFVIYKSFEKVSITLINRQEYLFNTYSNTGFINYLSSGRTLRFNKLIFNPLQKFGDSFIDTLHSIIMFLFGNGLSTDYFQTFEMDIFDVYLLIGIVGSFIFLQFNFIILFKVIKSQNKLINYISLIVVMLASCVVGHVWTGGVCGIYFAILSVSLMKNENKLKVIFNGNKSIFCNSTLSDV